MTTANLIANKLLALLVVLRMIELEEKKAFELEKTDGFTGKIYRTAL